jgi:hypothetical protein
LRVYLTEAQKRVIVGYRVELLLLRPFKTKSALNLRCIPRRGNPIGEIDMSQQYKSDVAYIVSKPADKRTEADNAYLEMISQQQVERLRARGIETDVIAEMAKVLAPPKPTQPQREKRYEAIEGSILQREVGASE